MANNQLTDEELQTLIIELQQTAYRLNGTNSAYLMSDTIKPLRELQERRKAERDSEPVAIVEPSDYVTAAQIVGEGPARKAVHELYEGALRIGDKLYRHAPITQQEPVLSVQFKNGWPVDGTTGVISGSPSLSDGYHDFYAAAQPEISDDAMENFRTAMEGIGHIRRTLEETFGGMHGTHVEPDVLAECKAICDAICLAYRKTAPQPAPTVRDSEPVAWQIHTPETGVTYVETKQQSVENIRNGFGIKVEITPLYRHAQQPPVVGDGRAEFETWMLKRWGRERRDDDFAMGKFIYGEDYADSYTRCVWKAWSACRAAMLQAGNSPVIPEGYVMVPMRLTAENGAKGALSGEFSETKFVNCPECFGDDECETCDGSGRIEITVPVTWTTIKEIWAKGVEHFAAALQEVPDGK